MLNKMEVPSGWSYPIIGDLFSVYRGKSFPRRMEVEEGGYFYLHYGDIHNSPLNYISLGNGEAIPKIDINLDEISEDYLLKTGDIALTDASEDLDDLCKSVLVLNPSDEVFISGLHTLILKANTDNVSIDFRRFILHTQNVKLQIRKLGTGATVYGMTKENLPKIKILLPPLPEQHKIAAILSSVDNAIQATKKVIHKTQRLKKGLMQQLLTKGIGHTEFKDTKLARIPKCWEVQKLIDFAILQRGFDLPVQNRIEGNIPILAANGIIGYHNEHKVKGPGVVTGRSGTIGKVIFINEDFWPLNTSLWIKEFHNNDPYFVHLKLKIIRLEYYGTGGAVPTLNRNHVHPLKVSIPPYSEQIMISKIIRNKENNIMAYHKELTKLRELKKSLMQQLLTGKIRVK